MMLKLEDVCRIEQFDRQGGGQTALETIESGWVLLTRLASETARTFLNQSVAFLSRWQSHKDVRTAICPDMNSRHLCLAMNEE
jgi:hypothetical protein